GPAGAASAGRLSNGQCTLTPAASSASISGDALTVRFAISFAPGFVGRRGVFLDAVDGAGAAAATLALGVWYGSGTVVSRVARYRLYDPFTHSHHYTTDTNEYTTLARRGFSPEGVDCMVYNGPA